jgi:hypothetical protein
MGDAAGVVVFYTLIILYAFFKFIVMYHVIKNNKGYFWMLAVLIPGLDFYYYFKYIKDREA